MLFNRSTRIALLAQLSELTQRIQRLEANNASMRARIDAEATLRTVSAQIVAAAQSASMIGSAIESFAQAMRVPLQRGRAGGLARARQAALLNERWLDGRFMTHEEREYIDYEVVRADYVRHAVGGFARAANAVRRLDGTFAPSV